jgi:hypothetical protein
MYEKLEGHLSFFERAIRKPYADNPLGGWLIVEWVSGDKYPLSYLKSHDLSIEPSW